jgi:hypothetical protein
MSKGNKETPADKAGVISKTLKIRFLLSPTGKFGLAYNEQEEADLPANQANELVEAKYAEFIK